MFLYFIQEVEKGNIKIGVTNDPLKRLAQLQSGNSDLLSIRGLAIGSEIAEFALHLKFTGHRIRGEWFKPGPEVVAFMDTLPTFHEVEQGEPMIDLDDEFETVTIGYKMAGLSRRRVKRG